MFHQAFNWTLWLCWRCIRSNWFELILSDRFYAFSFEVTVLAHCFRFQCCHSILSSADSKANLIKLMSHFMRCNIARQQQQWHTLLFNDFIYSAWRRVENCIWNHFLSKIETINYFRSCFEAVIVWWFLSLVSCIHPLSLSTTCFLSLPFHPLSLFLDLSLSLFLSRYSLFLFIFACALPATFLFSQNVAFLILVVAFSSLPLYPSRLAVSSFAFALNRRTYMQTNYIFINPICIPAPCCLVISLTLSLASQVLIRIW